MKGVHVFVENNIKDLRQNMKLSQANLAKKLGVSRQTINALETGRYNPSITLAFKIARVFEMTIEEIFIYNDEEE